MDSETARQARTILRQALKGSLASLDRESGAPYVSMVGLATEFDGSPILLLSSLAQHTANILANPDTSLLLDSTDASGDPNSGQRLTLTGRVVKTTGPTVQQRYLARHPGAAVYADFSDFSFWRMEILRGHFIGGFGRIQPMRPEMLRLDGGLATDFGRGERALVEELNRQPQVMLQGILGKSRTAAPDLGSSSVAGSPQQCWRITGIDPEGADLRAGTATIRILFPEQAATIAQARHMLAGRS